jgi:hypothetical protein
MPQETDPVGQRSQQELLQDVVRSATRAHSGEDKMVIRRAIARGLDEVGLPPQPEKWLDDTASEIAEGRHVVVDRQLGVSNGPGADEVPRETGRD